MGGKNRKETLYNWRKKNLKRIAFDLNLTTDREVYEHLEKQPNKRQYLIGLILEDIKR